MVKRRAVVDVVFSIDGIVGRETYDTLVVDRSEPLIRAWGELEWEMIESGLPTWECGCCLSTGSGVRLISMRERDAPESPDSSNSSNSSTAAT